MSKFKIFPLLVLLFLVTACATPVVAPEANEAAQIEQAATKQDQAIDQDEGVQASLTLLVDGQEGALFNEYLDIAEGTILLDQMRKLAAEGKIQMETQGEGETAFVDSLNGNKGDAATNRYWMLYVNNELATVGAGSYVIQDGDAIEWRYMDTSEIEL